MNILILYKDNENKNIIKDSNNNNLYFFKQKEKVFCVILRV